MTAVKIQAVLGVDFAEIDLSKIALIAGHNASGKSSVVEATRAALTRDPMIRGITKKAAGDSVVKRGATKGSVALGDGENWVRVAWPAASVEEKGPDVPRSSRVAAGVETISGMTVKERQAFLHALLRAEPDEEMFVAALTQNGIAEDGAKKAWALLQEKGWDVFHGLRVEAGRRLKGQWEEVTVENYGVNKASAWTPTGYDPTRADLGEDDWLNLIAKIRAEVEAEVGRAAVGAAVWEQRHASASKAPVLRLQLEGATGRHADHEKRLQALATARQNLAPLPGDVATCPHCQKAIVPRVKDPRTGIWLVDKGPETLPSNTNLRELQQQHGSIEQEIQTQRAGLQAALIEVNRLKQECAAAATDEVWISENEAPADDGEGEALIAARERLRQEQVAHAAWKAKTRAAEIGKSIEANAVLIAALAPDGLRRKRASEVIGTWVRECVDPVCKAWDMAPISFDENMAILCDGAPYSLLAESEKYRVDAALQIATALQDGSYAIVLDRADVLLPSLRNKMFSILAGLDRPAMVAMAARDRDKVPQLADHGIGVSYWMASGTATEIGAKA